MLRNIQVRSSTGTATIGSQKLSHLPFRPGRHPTSVFAILMKSWRTIEMEKVSMWILKRWRNQQKKKSRLRIRRLLCESLMKRSGALLVLLLKLTPQTPPHCDTSKTPHPAKSARAGKFPGFRSGEKTGRGFRIRPGSFSVGLR
jgi:hexokinase